MPDASGKASNTLILFSPDGKTAGIYRKTHLFSMFGEQDHLTPGDSLGIVDAAWGRAGFSICYDLRFPELFRAYALRGVEVQFLSAAFPAVRLEHWKTLIKARAIEDQMFMVAVNRVGSEDMGENGEIVFGGCSMIIDPWGNTVVEAGGKEEGLVTSSINITDVKKVRVNMKVLTDRRPDIYKI